MKKAVLFAAIFIVLFTGATLTFVESHTQRHTSHSFKQSQKDKELDRYYSDKKLGAFTESGNTVFRLFAPQADKVTLCTYEKPEQKNPREYPMSRDNDGVWEVSVEGEQYGLYYGFKVYNPGLWEQGDTTIVLDPYAKAVTTFNTYKGTRRGIVMKEGDFDWEGDTWIQRDWRDLIIYEMHIRDMTAHPTSGAGKKGTYAGLVEKGKRGGIDYIKSLGVNTVEILPAMEFANIEIPYNEEFMGRKNTWNPYERNHWGYMTAAFFAPEAYYAEDWKQLTWNVWEGKSGRQVNEFKKMVKAFHKEGIAVIMDVVYNHISEYEFGNFKEIDKEYYFRLDEKGNFIAESYCGNDFKTERPMARRLIVESILYWMKEYHVDGFRFDLGKLLDWETIELVIREAKKINPNVIIVCEPWGGGYDPQGFSLRGWGAWNDQIRNGIKGENPLNGHGWIFGKWYGNNNPDRIKSYVNGTLTRDKHGLFIKKEHSVNYLESHDGYTLSDFIRIAAGEAPHDKPIEKPDDIRKLSLPQSRLNKLAAMFLMTSQGMVMIHSGQEYARSKIIPMTITEQDKHKGMIDHNTYDKDNETNYLNYDHADLNKSLLDYYKGLIAIRNTHASFRRAEYEDVVFMPVPAENHFALGYTVSHEGEQFAVLFNANHNKKQEFKLPKGNWEVLADHLKAGITPLRSVSGKAELEPVTALILRLKK